MRNPFEGYKVTTSWLGHILRGSLGGIDYAMKVDTPLPSMLAGTARAIPNNGTGGHTIIVTDSAGFSVSYMHLKTFAVRSGARVAAGDIVGYSGGAKGAPGAGSSTGPHLHVHANLNGKRRNVLDFVTKPVPAAVGIRDIRENKETQMFIRNSVGAIAVLLPRNGPNGVFYVKSVLSGEKWEALAKDGYAYVTVPDAYYNEFVRV